MNRDHILESKIDELDKKLDTLLFLVQLLVKFNVKEELDIFEKDDLKRWLDENQTNFELARN